MEIGSFTIICDITCTVLCICFINSGQIFRRQIQLYIRVSADSTNCIFKRVISFNICTAILACTGVSCSCYICSVSTIKNVISLDIWKRCRRDWRLLLLPQSSIRKVSRREQQGLWGRQVFWRFLKLSFLLSFVYFGLLPFSFFGLSPFGFRAFALCFRAFALWFSGFRPLSREMRTEFPPDNSRLLRTHSADSSVRSFANCFVFRLYFGEYPESMQEDCTLPK